MKTEQVMEERPVYHEEELDMWLHYHGRKHRWVVSKGSVKGSQLVSSLKTDVFAPDLTEWHGTTSALRVHPRGHKDQRGGGWIDRSLFHMVKKASV